MDLSFAEVQAFLPAIPPSKLARATAWVTAIEAELSGRYGARVTEAQRPAFVSYAADAVERRLQRTDKTVAQQNIGPAGVRYTDKSGLGGWFWPEEIEAMDRLTGLAGASTVRMAAPDAIRYANVNRLIDGDEV